MVLVALKCPNCSRDIQLDVAEEFGFCTYCGTRIMLLEPNPVSVKPGCSDDLENLLKIARATVDDGSATELQDLTDRILELDPENWFGWYVEGVAAAKLSSCRDMYDAWETAAYYAPETEIRTHWNASSVTPQTHPSAPY